MCGESDVSGKRRIMNDFKHKPPREWPGAAAESSLVGYGVWERP